MRHSNIRITVEVVMTAVIRVIVTAALCEGVGEGVAIGECCSDEGGESVISLWEV